MSPYFLRRAIIIDRIKKCPTMYSMYKGYVPLHKHLDNITGPLKTSVKIIVYTILPWGR